MNNFIGLKRIGQNKKAAEKLTTREALKAMAEFYEFDKKKTEFFIRQLELSGKI